MTSVRGCLLPDELLYDVENNMWYREDDDGTVTVGMTAVAAAMAGQLVAITPKRVGRSIKPGKSCATVESGKWVGPAKLAGGGEVVAVNDDLVADPAIANADPYGAGWVLRIRPDGWEETRASLVTGPDVAPAYESKMDADGFAGCEA